MILRRLADAITAQNWFTVVLEVLIVVVGIFIGLQVDDWNERREDQAQGNNYLRFLIADLDVMQSRLAAQFEHEKDVARLVNQTLDRIDEDPTAERNRQLGILLVGLSNARRTLVLESPTFTDLQNSGNLELISDAVLRDKIISYFSVVERWVAVTTKTNEIFADEYFTGYLIDVGIGFSLWEDLEGIERSQISKIEMKNFEDILRERYDDRVLAAKNDILTSPKEAVFWNNLVQRISWRAIAASRNEDIAQRLMELTEKMKADISIHLAGSAP